MGLCSSNATDPDDDEDKDEYSLSVTQTLVDGGAGNTSASNIFAGGDSGSNKGSAKKKGANAKYPWVDESHFVTDVYQYFDIERELGRWNVKETTRCRVLKVKERSTGAVYAMKEMRRDDKWSPMLFKQEANILGKQSGHEDYWVDFKNFYVLTALCTGGELFDQIKELRHSCFRVFELHGRRSMRQELPGSMDWEARDCSSDGDLVIVLLYEAVGSP